MELSTIELADLIAAARGDRDEGPTAPDYPDATSAGAVIVRTVTHYYVGTLDREDSRWLYLRDCSWVADTGRWSTALATGTLNEVEPYPDGVVVRVSVGAVVDVAPWRHTLPRSVK